MCVLCVSRPNGAAGWPLPSLFPRPLGAHHTAVLALLLLILHWSLPLPSSPPSAVGVRFQRHALRTPRSWTGGQRLDCMDWRRNGGTDGPRPNQPSIPVGGLSSLVSHEPAVTGGHLLRRLPPRHRPPLLWHPGPDQGGRPASLMLRESPQPVTVKAALASWLAE
jgi:hypothetical protein